LNTNFRVPSTRIYVKLLCLQHDYGLDDRNKFPSGAMMGIFSCRHRIQTDFGVHLASYSMDTGGS